MSETRRKGDGFQPSYAVAPGETLAELLEEQGMTQTQLAGRLGVTTKHLNQVIKGSASISAELSLGLEKVFSVPAAFWLTRESVYRAQLARQAEQEVLKKSVSWAECFPIRELKARGLIASGAKGEALVEALLQFLGVASPEQWQQPAVSYRKSQKLESDDFALATWLRIGEIRARQIDCEPFDADRFRDALEEARELTNLGIEESSRRLVELCAECGVAVVIIKQFKEAKVNGATKWLTPHKALIQLSLRYKWEDIFWFTFFHEAGHVLLHRKKLMLVDEDKGPKLDPELATIEDEANRFAARTLIPSRYEQRMQGLGVAEVPLLAKQIGVSPAIVVGRMQHDGNLAWNKGHHLRRLYEFKEPTN